MGSNYYNLPLDELDYSGPEHQFQLNNLREGRCYRIQVPHLSKQETVQKLQVKVLATGHPVIVHVNL